MTWPQITATFGLLLDIVGVVMLGLFVRQEIYCNGHMEVKKKGRFYFGWGLIILGLLLQIGSLWLPSSAVFPPHH